MEALDGVAFIQGDFREADVLAKLQGIIGNRSVDLVISDMAPNSTGIKAVDQPRGMYLSELAVDFARQCLRPRGDLLLKAFQGQGFDALLKSLRRDFTCVVSRKPRCSRSRSSEIYILARNYGV
jgi:23S rRNA (uridine2552-2'-O)-methyltransferase